jgi:hypothetical protein
MHYGQQRRKKKWHEQTLDLAIVSFLLLLLCPLVLVLVQVLSRLVVSKKKSENEYRSCR